MTRKAAMNGLLILLAFAVASCSNDSSSGFKDKTPPQAELLMPLDGSTREGVIDVTVDANDEYGIDRVELFVSGKLVGTDKTVPYSFEYDMTPVADGATVSFYVRAFDIKGNKAQSDPVVVTKGDSKPPVATLINPASGLTVMQGDEVVLEGSATDPEDGVMQPFTISWSSNLQGDLYNGNSNKNNVIRYRGFVIGTHTITMTAQDSDGNIDTETVQITVTDNDKDYAYVQEGRYKVGPPLFQERSVIITRPFLIAKKELSLKEFMDNIKDATIEKALPKRDFGTASKETHPTDYPSDYFSDYEKYGNYPAVFIKYFEFVVFCQNLSLRDGYTPAFYFLDKSNILLDATDRKAIEKSVKVVLDPLTGGIDETANGWRIPTEAEWMVAAAGGNAVKAYPWGNDIPASRCNTMDDPSPQNMVVIAGGRGLSPVDSYKEYKNAFGLLNMAGNAAELTSDIFQNEFPSGTDYVGYSDVKQVEYVVKGGSWYGFGSEAKIPMRMDRMWYEVKDDYKGQGDYDSGITIRLVRNLDVGEAPW